MIFVRAQASFSDPGGQRPIQEDHILIDPALGLYLVSDGYGGHGSGDKVPQEILEVMRVFVKKALSDHDATLPFLLNQSLTYSGNVLLNAMHVGNERLLHLNKKTTIHQRAGMSVMAVLVEPSHCIVASVGVCQAFLIRQLRTQVLFRSQSYVATKSLFQGSFNSKFALPYQSLGHHRDFLPNILELKPQSQDVMILSTDGVYPRLTHEDVAESVKEIFKAPVLEEGLLTQNRHLIEIAQQKGNSDNQAIVSLIFQDRQKKA